MDVLAVIVADRVEITPGGKANIIGIFDTLNVSRFPGRINPFSCYVRCLFQAVEAENLVELTTTLYDPERQPMFSAVTKFRVPRSGIDGEGAFYYWAIELTDQTVVEPGRYEICLFHNATEVYALPLYVVPAN